MAAGSEARERVQGHIKQDYVSICAAQLPHYLQVRGFAHYQQVD
jgi:hypothetical protein